MQRELLIAAGPGEWRAALLEDGEPVELYVERGDVKPAGSVHLGRVVYRAPGLDSAFVEIGDERPGMLPLREAAKDGIRLDDGARVLVQVRREAQLGKGARLSTRLLGAAAERASQQAPGAEPPAQLYPLPGFAAALALRLSAAPERVTVDDPAVSPDLRRAFPAAETGHSPAADWPIDVDAAIEQALLPSVPLEGGGALHIQQMRAAVLIDVDTGTPQAGSAERGRAAVNRAAAQAIAREMRLRNIAGGIVADFAGVDGRGQRERIRQDLETAFAGDPAKPHVLGWTRLDHLELVRPRHGRSLAEAMLEPALDAVPRKHAVATAHEALRRLAREARAWPAANWRLTVGKRIEPALRGPAAAALRALETRLGRKIEIAVSESLPRDFDIAPL